jgi:hypothetical protein
VACYEQDDQTCMKSKQHLSINLIFEGDEGLKLVFQGLFVHVLVLSWMNSLIVILD